MFPVYHKKQALKLEFDYSHVLATSRIEFAENFGCVRSHLFLFCNRLKRRLIVINCLFHYFVIIRCICPRDTLPPFCKITSRHFPGGRSWMLLKLTNKLCLPGLYSEESEKIPTKQGFTDDYFTNENYFRENYKVNTGFDNSKLEDPSECVGHISIEFRTATSNSLLLKAGSSLTNTISEQVSDNYINTTKCMVLLLKCNKLKNL